jgi:Glyoxalase-like domain
MAARLTEIVVDSTDPRLVARFWGEVLGWSVTDDAS